LAHLRLTPPEYRAIRSLCRDIHLRDDLFPIFRYFLAEALHERWPALAGRVALLGQPELRLLFRHLQARKNRADRAGQGPAGSGSGGLSEKDLEAVAWAARCFLLCGGRRAGFREFLLHYFQAEAPALADKLAQLSERGIAELYRRARRSPPRRQ
jgi:hypothetical protein